MIIIPFVNYPFFRESLTIDNVTYVFEFLWNHRGEYWVLNVFDNNNVLLIAGVKVVLEFDVLKRYSKVSLPLGVMLAIRKNSNSKEKIDKDEMGNTVNLIYITESEYVSI